MKKFTKRMLVMFTLPVLVFAAALTTQAPAVAAGGGDCDTVAKVCRQGNEMLYNLCVAITGDYAACALQEAQSNIDCITSNGCPYNH